MNDDFETQLKQQPLKRIPDEWRREILSEFKNEEELSGISNSPIASIIQALTQRPKLALGAVWILIAILNLTGPATLNTKTLAKQKRASTPTPELIAAIEQQFFRLIPHPEDKLPTHNRQPEPSQPPKGQRSHLNRSVTRIAT